MIPFLFLRMNFGPDCVFRLSRRKSVVKKSVDRPTRRMVDLVFSRRWS